MNFYITEHGMRTDFEYGELDVSGNEEFGFRPYQLLVSAIVGCSGSVFRKIIEKQRIVLEDLTIKAEVERNEHQANRVEQIKLTFIVKGKHLDPERMQKNLEISRKNCSMVRSVESSIDIEEKLELIELSM